MKKTPAAVRTRLAVLLALAVLAVGPAFAQIIQPGQSVIRTGEGAPLLSTQNADNVAITGGAINGTVIGGTTPAAGSFTTLSASSGISSSGSGQFAPLYGGGTTAANASLQAPTVASAVNQVVISGAATAGTATLVAGGSSSDTNAPIALAGKGTGSTLIGGTTTTVAGLQVGAVASQVNNIGITPTATGTVPAIAITGASADANRNLNVAARGTGIVTLGQALQTASGATPQTANGQRVLVTTNSLSTAAATDAAFVINNSSVASTSLVVCTINAYSGTLGTNGDPVITQAVPGSGTITLNIRNVNATNALAGTVGLGCIVLN